MSRQLAAVRPQLPPHAHMLPSITERVTPPPLPNSGSHLKPLYVDDTSHKLVVLDETQHRVDGVDLRDILEHDLIPNWHERLHGRTANRNSALIAEESRIQLVFIDYIIEKLNKGRGKGTDNGSKMETKNYFEFPTLTPAPVDQHRVRFANDTFNLPYLRPTPVQDRQVVPEHDSGFGRANLRSLPPKQRGGDGYQADDPRLARFYLPEYDYVHDDPVHILSTGDAHFDYKRFLEEWNTPRALYNVNDTAKRRSPKSLSPVNVPSVLNRLVSNDPTNEYAVPTNREIEKPQKNHQHVPSATEHILPEESIQHAVDDEDPQPVNFLEKRPVVNNWYSQENSEKMNKILHEYSTALQKNNNKKEAEVRTSSPKPASAVSVEGQQANTAEVSQTRPRSPTAQSLSEFVVIAPQLAPIVANLNNVSAKDGADVEELELAGLNVLADVVAKLRQLIELLKVNADQQRQQHALFMRNVRQEDEQRQKEKQKQDPDEAEKQEQQMPILTAKEPKNRSNQMTQTSGESVTPNYILDLIARVTRLEEIVATPLEGHEKLVKTQSAPSLAAKSLSLPSNYTSKKEKRPVPERVTDKSVSGRISPPTKMPRSREDKVEDLLPTLVMDNFKKVKVKKKSDSSESDQQASSLKPRSTSSRDVDRDDAQANLLAKAKEQLRRRSKRSTDSDPSNEEDGAAEWRHKELKPAAVLAVLTKERTSESSIEDQPKKRLKSIEELLISAQIESINDNEKRVKTPERVSNKKQDSEENLPLGTVQLRPTPSIERPSATNQDDTFEMPQLRPTPQTDRSGNLDINDDTLELPYLRPAPSVERKPAANDDPSFLVIRANLRPINPRAATNETSKDEQKPKDLEKDALKFDITPPEKPKRGFLETTNQEDNKLSLQTEKENESEKEKEKKKEHHGLVAQIESKLKKLGSKSSHESPDRTASRQSLEYDAAVSVASGDSASLKSSKKSTTPFTALAANILKKYKSDRSLEADKEGPKVEKEESQRRMSDRMVEDNPRRRELSRILSTRKVHTDDDDVHSMVAYAVPRNDDVGEANKQEPVVQRRKEAGKIAQMRDKLLGLNNEKPLAKSELHMRPSKSVLERFLKATKEREKSDEEHATTEQNSPDDLPRTSWAFNFLDELENQHKSVSDAEDTLEKERNPSQSKTIESESSNGDKEREDTKGYYTPRAKSPSAVEELVTATVTPSFVRKTSSFTTDEEQEQLHEEPARQSFLGGVVRRSPVPTVDDRSTSIVSGKSKATSDTNTPTSKRSSKKSTYELYSTIAVNPPSGGQAGAGPRRQAPQPNDVKPVASKPDSVDPHKRKKLLTRDKEGKENKESRRTRLFEYIPKKLSSKVNFDSVKNKTDGKEKEKSAANTKPSFGSPHTISGPVRIEKPDSDDSDDEPVVSPVKPSVDPKLVQKNDKLTDIEEADSKLELSQSTDTMKTPLASIPTNIEPTKPDKSKPEAKVSAISHLVIGQPDIAENADNFYESHAARSSKPVLHNKEKETRGADKENKVSSTQLRDKLTKLQKNREVDREKTSKPIISGPIPIANDSEDDSDDERRAYVQSMMSENQSKHSSYTSIQAENEKLLKSTNLLLENIKKTKRRVQEMDQFKTISLNSLEEDLNDLKERQEEARNKQLQMSGDVATDTDSHSSEPFKLEPRRKSTLKSSREIGGDVVQEDLSPANIYRREGDWHKSLGEIRNQHVSIEIEGLDDIAVIESIRGDSQAAVVEEPRSTIKPQRSASPAPAGHAPTDILRRLRHEASKLPLVRDTRLAKEKHHSSSLSNLSVTDNRKSQQPPIDRHKLKQKQNTGICRAIRNKLK